MKNSKSCVYYNTCGSRGCATWCKGHTTKAQIKKSIADIKKDIADGKTDGYRIPAPRLIEILSDFLKD